MMQALAMLIVFKYTYGAQNYASIISGPLANINKLPNKYLCCFCYRAYVSNTDQVFGKGSRMEIGSSSSSQ